MSRVQRKYVFVGDGCATGWIECPNGADAITVRREEWTLTECRRRGEVGLVESP